MPTKARRHAHIAITAWVSRLATAVQQAQAVGDVSIYVQQIIDESRRLRDGR